MKCIELREINFGLWEELSWNDIEISYPSESQKYLKDPLNFTFPMGESYTDVKSRVFKWINDLQKTDYMKVEIITHGRIIRTILSSKTNQLFWDINFQYEEGIRIEI